ncbi:hypothetical protein QQZ08_008547 [Neonectria magnoliae]|uniref:Pectate lyase n=1 Tax=Neonectria magnoliae TaxID=2732573 RepID=A0ABR1HUM5_9HYPO
MPVSSNKDIISAGNKRVLHGKDLRSNTGAKNTIIQNIHIDYFNYTTDHNFDITATDRVLLEGNRFENSKAPIIEDNSTVKIFKVPDSSSRATCVSSLGRNCEKNALSTSGAWPSRKDGQQQLRYRKD